jgi:hypothetical protein
LAAAEMKPAAPGSQLVDDDLIARAYLDGSRRLDDRGSLGRR